jgi:hypothetical protein
VLSWDVSVYRQVHNGSAPADRESERGARVASWRGEVEALRWIDELVREGRALSLGGNGYPFRYTARSADLIQPILKGPPHARARWAFGQDGLPAQTGAVDALIDVEGLNATGGEWLIVEAWDES